jgi:hypothetical protein
MSSVYSECSDYYSDHSEYTPVPQVGNNFPEFAARKGRELRRRKAVRDGASPDALDPSASGSTVLQLANERLHLVDLALLAFDDLVRQVACARVGELGALAGEDGDGVVRDHGPHP